MEFLGTISSSVRRDNVLTVDREGRQLFRRLLMTWDQHQGSRPWMNNCIPLNIIDGITYACPLYLFWLCNQCAHVSTPFSSSILNGHHVGLRYRLDRSMTPNQPITQGFSENHRPTSHRKLEYPQPPWYLPETAKVIPNVTYILRRYSMPSDCCSITIRCLFTFCRIQLF